MGHPGGVLQALVTSMPSYTWTQRKLAAPPTFQFQHPSLGWFLDSSLKPEGVQLGTGIDMKDICGINICIEKKLRLQLVLEKEHLLYLPYISYGVNYH